MKDKDLVPQQTIWGLLQPATGDLENRPEGAGAKANYILFCRLTPNPDDPDATDVLENELLTESCAGALTREFRVVDVSDAGGQKDHLEIYLYFDKPKGG